MVSGFLGVIADTLNLNASGLGIRLNRSCCDSYSRNFQGTLISDSCGILALTIVL